MSNYDIDEIPAKGRKAGGSALPNGFLRRRLSKLERGAVPAGDEAWRNFFNEQQRLADAGLLFRLATPMQQATAADFLSASD